MIGHVDRPGNAREVVSPSLGFLIGCVFFLIVEGGFRVVDWADSKMRMRTDE
jgi:hypothetical protein